MGTLLRVGAALLLAATALPLGAAGAAGSQSGDDHKVTLCHRTNAENNPYVVITIDKAGVFKVGHDSHDEGGVHHAGDKAAGIRWGDIIPPFSYYASPQDEKAGTLSQYPGLNWTAEGQAYYANGCNAPGTPEQPSPEPAGSLSGACTDADDFVVTGRTDADGTDADFRLAIAGQAAVDVARDADFQVTVTAPAGTVVTLEYWLGSGGWTSTGETATVTDCPPTPPTQPVAPTGSLATVCTATGALVDIGALHRGTETGGRFELVVNGSAQRVTSGQQDIAVAGGAALVLQYVAPGGTASTLDSETAPVACPATTPPPPPAEQRGLTLSKVVTPTGTAGVGDTLTYTLTVTTTGNAAQTDVTVSDVLPGYASGTTSGRTSYVAGSATCAGSGTCTTSYDAGAHRVTWGLGTLAAGTSRAVSFQVVIDEPADASAPADVVNVGSVRSAQVGETPSNEVVTPLAAVQGVKNGSGGGGEDTGSAPVAGGQLPHTGAGERVAWMLSIAGLLILAGIGLLGTAGRVGRQH